MGPTGRGDESSGCTETVGPVAIAGQFAYTSVGNRVVVVDITNGATPLVVGHTSALPESPAGVAVAGSRAYVAGPGYLDVFDIADVAHPIQVGAPLEGLGPGGPLVVVGGYAYLAQGGEGLTIVDISDPGLMTEVGGYMVHHATDVSVVGGYAYLTAALDGLIIIQASPPQHPVPVAVAVAERGRSVYSNPAYYASVVAVVGPLAYVGHANTHGQGGLGIVDVADPERPRELSFFTLQAEITGLVVVRGRAYLSDEAGDVYIFDVTAPSQPVQVGFLPNAGHIRGSVESPPYIFVSACNALRIMGPSDARGLELVGATDQWGTARR